MSVTGIGRYVPNRGEFMVRCVVNGGIPVAGE
jgi:hypothetical protein